MVSWNYRMGFDKFQEGFAKLRDSSTALHVDFSWYGMPFSKATWVVSTIRGSWRSWAPGTMLSKLFEHIMVRSCLSTTTLVSFCGLMKSFHWTNYYRFINRELNQNYWEPKTNGQAVLSNINNRRVIEVWVFRWNCQRVHWAIYSNTEELRSFRTKPK